MSSYPAFDIKIDNDDGTTTPLPAQTIHVYDVTNDELLDDIASDVDGHVAGGALDVDPGTLVRFAFFREDNLLCGYSEVITT